jgi:phage gp46-like protein
MTDIALHWNGETFSSDIAMGNADLATDDDLATSVIMSLFSWRRANSDDVLPDNLSHSRMGWWGDSFPLIENEKFGSRLWLLRREKLTTETIARAVDYCREALQWLVNQRIASQIDVDAFRSGIDQLSLSIVIHQFNNKSRNLLFDNVWQAIQRDG